MSLIRKDLPTLNDAMMSRSAGEDLPKNKGKEPLPSKCCCATVPTISPFWPCWLRLLRLVVKQHQDYHMVPSCALKECKHYEARFIIRKIIHNTKDYSLNSNIIIIIIKSLFS